jgi:hypothetical protein
MKLFNGLQRIMTGKFSQNVFRSFSKFMKNKYGLFNYLNCVRTFNSSQGNKRSNGLRKILKDQKLALEFFRDFETGTEAVKQACRSFGSSICRRSLHDG